MLKKILLGVLILVCVLALGLVITINVRYDRTFEAPYPDIKASKDSAVIARGRALAFGPAHCANCHAPIKDFVKVDQGEPVALSGGFNFDLPIGTIFAPNITPDMETGIGKLTDGEIARALRFGVRHDGRAILDFMPFYDLSDQDLTAIISYLRSMEPVQNVRPPHEWNLLGKGVLSFLIEPAGDAVVPEPVPVDSTVEYGKYLAASVANCRGCHTKRDMMTGGYIGPEYAGGTQFEMVDAEGNFIKGKHLVTPNLTTDKETGRITGWTKKDFIGRFRKGRIIAGSAMPWGPFSRMSDLELTAIYKFITSLDPVRNQVPLGIQEGDPE